MSCPTDHPHYLGTELRGFLEEADLIIIADSDVPWLPHVQQPAQGAKIIHVSRDPSYQSYPIRGFPIDLAIVGDPGITFKLAAEKILGNTWNKKQSARRWLKD
jgi:acetolactate synthase-1/2/3 large subunit